MTVEIVVLRFLILFQPGIISLEDFFDVDDALYIVLELYVSISFALFCMFFMDSTFCVCVDVINFSLYVS